MTTTGAALPSAVRKAPAATDAAAAGVGLWINDAGLFSSFWRLPCTAQQIVAGISMRHASITAMYMCRVSSVTGASIVSSRCEFPCYFPCYFPCHFFRPSLSSRSLLRGRSRSRGAPSSLPNARPHRCDAPLLLPSGTVIDGVTRLPSALPLMSPVSLLVARWWACSWACRMLAYTGVPGESQVYLAWRRTSAFGLAG